MAPEEWFKESDVAEHVAKLAYITPAKIHRVRLASLWHLPSRGSGGGGLVAAP